MVSAVLQLEDLFVLDTVYLGTHCKEGGGGEGGGRERGGRGEKVRENYYICTCSWKCVSHIIHVHIVYT